MRAGRKKTARNLVLIRGNPGKRSVGGETLAPEPLTELTPPPDWLEPYAKEEWLERGPELLKLGLLDRTNLTSFAAYCQSFARWRGAEEFLTNNKTSVMVLKNEDGKTIRYVQALPQVTIAQQEKKAMRAFASEFGLTPNSLAALKLERPQQSARDRLEDVLNG